MVCCFESPFHYSQSNFANIPPTNGSATGFVLIIIHSRHLDAGPILGCILERDNNQASSLHLDSILGGCPQVSTFHDISYVDFPFKVESRLA